MSLYTVRKLGTGELYGKNLTVIEAALVILNHAVARYDISPMTQTQNNVPSVKKGHRFPCRRSAINNNRKTET